jgi:hypothetical protein
MSSMNKNLGRNPSGPLRSALRPVLRALVVSGWMWIPGLPPQEWFGNPWPFDSTDPVRPVRPAERVTVASSRP